MKGKTDEKTDEKTGEKTDGRSRTFYPRKSKSENLLQKTRFDEHDSTDEGSKTKNGGKKIIFEEKKKKTRGRKRIYGEKKKGPSGQQEETSEKKRIADEKKKMKGGNKVHTGGIFGLTGNINSSQPLSNTSMHDGSNRSISNNTYTQDDNVQFFSGSTGIQGGNVPYLSDNTGIQGDNVQFLSDNTRMQGGNNSFISNNTSMNFSTMANPPLWKVVNYQIPVPIGDCSAHFLVDKMTGDVHRAFLMDGGMNAGIYAAWAQILKGLRFIDLELGNDWKFDSWVVTHWDEDHYRGVKDLLVNPGIEFTRCKRNGTSITKSNPENFASLYFKPTAVLCCGAWDVKAMFKGGGDFLSPFVKEDQRQHWEDLKDANERSKQGKELLRCLCGEDLIGLDLFTRSFHFDRKTGNPDYKAADETFSIPLKSDGHDPASKNTPRFCVVGANGYGIGEPSACTLTPTRNQTSILALLYWPGQKFCSYYTGGDGHTEVFTGPVRDWFNKRWSKCDVEMVKLDHHGSTGENLGKTPHTEDKGKSKVVNKDFEEEKASVEEVPSESDTESESESVSEMVEENLDTPDDLEIEVTNDQEKAMKGAKEIGIVIEYMNPRKVLVTPGTRHGHPTWDVLIILREYFRDLSKVISRHDSDHKQVQGLFSTRSVYWFSKGKVSYKDINFKHVLGTVLQNRLQIAGEDGSGMAEEHDKQDPNDAGKGGEEIEEEDSDNDSSFDEVAEQIVDAPKRVKAQEDWAEWRKELVERILEENDSKAKYFTKSGERKNDAINLAVATALEKYEQKRRNNTPRESLMKGTLSNPGTKLNILENLMSALDELTQANDDAQLEGVENFEEICWQPLVASENEDPHFLVRFEFGDERKDTVLQVFDDSGQYEYEEESKQDKKKEGKQSNNKRPRRSNKKGSIHEEGKQEESKQEESIQEESIQRCRRIETGRLVKDRHNPWTKYAYGDCAIATMLSPDSLWTIAGPTIAARIRKSTKKKRPQIAKGEPKNMIYKYYAKLPSNSKTGIEEMITWNELNGSKRPEGIDGFPKEDSGGKKYEGIDFWR